MTHFDVILPTIARPSLREAVISVANQTHKNLSLRIAYDGYIGWPEEGEDPLGWQEALRGTDVRYTVMGLGGKQPRNDYGAYARNHEVRQELLKSLRGSAEELKIDWPEPDPDSWVAYIDDDDEWLPNHLATIAKLIEDNPGVNMVRTAGQSFMMKHKSPRSKKLVRKMGVVNSTDILTVGMAHTRGIFDKTQGWQPCDNHDHLLWKEMLAAGGKAVVSDAVTFHFRR